MAVAGPISWGGQVQAPVCGAGGAGPVAPPSHPFFVVVVFVVFVCVYWLQCLYHPVGTPSGWLPGERRSYLRLGRHLSKKKKFGQMDPFPSLSLSASLPLCLSVSLSLFLSVSLSFSLSFCLSLSLSLKHTLKHTHSLSWCGMFPVY